MHPISRFGTIAAPALLAAAALPALLAGAAQEAPPSREFGPLSIHGCELREARFEPPFRVLLPDGGSVLHRFGWEIVIRGADFPIRALDPILWVDQVALDRYERRILAGEQELAFIVVEPRLLRAEHALEVIYGRDERTRTRLFEPLDPEKLVKLPEAQRKALGIPDLEGVTITRAGRDGLVEGRGRLDGGRIQLALRLTDDSLKVVLGPVKLGADGAFSTRVVGVTDEVRQIWVLHAAPEVSLDPGPLRELPKGVEVLDRKPVAAKAAGR